MSNDPKQSNQATSDRVFSTLVSLVAANPASEQELSEVMMYVRSLEARCRENEQQPYVSDHPTEKQNNNDKHTTFHYSPTRKLDPHTYHWTDTALREHPHGEARSHLQVSIEDYIAVANAIEACSKNGELMTASDIGDTTLNYIDRKIPPTQMYLCIRYWRSKEMVARAGGRRLKIVDANVPFAKFAMNLIGN